MTIDGPMLVGIAAIVAAIGGLLTPFLSAWLILKVREVHTLTNHNFSELQNMLDESLKANKEQTERAAEIAAQLAISTEADAQQRRDAIDRERVNKSHLPKTAEPIDSPQIVNIQEPENVNVEAPRTVEKRKD